MNESRSVAIQVSDKILSHHLFFCILTRGQQVITNGDFESPGLPGTADYAYLRDGDPFVTGWTAINNGVGNRFTTRSGRPTLITGNMGLSSKKAVA